MFTRRGEGGHFRKFGRISRKRRRKGLDKPKEVCYNTVVIGAAA